MTTFYLPDLGEGLPDALIKEWYVSVGDIVEIDQPLLAMETAKAIVDVPSPHGGKILELNGVAGDIIKTGAPLVIFEAGQKETQDAGTVVGSMPEGAESFEKQFTVGKTSPVMPKITSEARALAREHNLNLSKLVRDNEFAVITKEDVTALIEHSIGGEPLTGVRREMARVMKASHEQVVPVSLYDDAILTEWSDDEDISVRVLEALMSAVKAEPALNVWFDDKQLTLKKHDEVHVGLAVDTEDGLFVPVMKNMEKLTRSQIREAVDRTKQGVRDRSFGPEDFEGHTITLSNFGKFAGRYASPIIMPPTVAIVAVGKLYDKVIEQNGEIVPVPCLPISLSFDHRVVTGGEAARFLGAMIKTLTQKVKDS